MLCRFLLDCSIQVLFNQVTTRNTSVYKETFFFLLLNTKNSAFQIKLIIWEIFLFCKDSWKHVKLLIDFYICWSFKIRWDSYKTLREWEFLNWIATDKLRYKSNLQCHIKPIIPLTSIPRLTHILCHFYYSRKIVPSKSNQLYGAIFFFFLQSFLEICQAINRFLLNMNVFLLQETRYLKLIINFYLSICFTVRENWYQLFPLIHAFMGKQWYLRKIY